MALKFWTLDGKIVVDGTGKPILCEECPCPGSNPLIMTCAACLGFGIPTNLNITYTYAGISKTVALTNVFNDGVTAIWSADFSSTGGTWAPCPGSGPRFNTAFSPDGLTCQCVDGSCKLIYRYTFDQFDDGSGVNGLENSVVLTDDPCTSFIHLMVLVATSPLNLTYADDLAAFLVGDCGVSTAFNLEVTVP